MAKTIRDDNIVDQTLIVDTDGNAVGVTNNKLDVNVTISPGGGGATEAKQDTQITAEQAILAKIIAAPATEARQDTVITALQLIDDTVGAPGGTAGTKITQLGGIAKSTTPTPVSDGQGVAVWMDTSGRLIGPAYNSGLGANDVNDVVPALTQFTRNVGIAQLAAPGSTVVVDVSKMGLYGYTFTVSSLDTTVVVSLTGNVDGTNYATLPLDNDAIANTSMSANQMTITLDGTYSIYSSAPMDQARLTFVSESGGEAALIDADFFGRRK